MEQLKHECGVAMIRLLKPLSYYREKYGAYSYGLNKLYLMMEKQHNRGQEAAGIGCVKLNVRPGNEYINRDRALGAGAIQEIFERVNHEIDAAVQAGEELENVPYLGEMYMGHLRYSTTGRSGMSYVHPFLRRNNWRSRNLMLCGNFNMTNVDEIYNYVVSQGQHPRIYSDTFMILEQLGHALDGEHQQLYDKFKDTCSDGCELAAKIEDNIQPGNILRREAGLWDGGFVICGMTGSGDMFALRDSKGIRPAFYYYDDEIIVLASERPVIQTVMNVSVEKVKELTPGSALIVSKSGKMHIEDILGETGNQRCSFERIYFSRGSDKDIYVERKALGQNVVPRVMKAIGNDLDNTVFSFIPNTAEVAFYGMMEGFEACLSKKMAEEIKQLNPSESDYDGKLQAIVSSIPGYKVLCKGNHDNQDDTFYKEIGFDEVCEICVIHNLVFSHKPVRIPMGYLNIHGHLHTEKMSTLGYQHINAYDSNFFERPMLVDDLIDSAAFQSPEEYAGTDLKHVEEKFEKYTSVENDNYTQIIDLTDMVGIYPVDEAAISWKNDKNEDVPKICPKCGSKVGVFLRGEPVYLCTNKKCEKYFGTVPFPENEAATDPLDEVLFSDITDVQYWENDDDAPKKKKVKQSPLDTDNQGVVAESTTVMNTFPFIYLSQENMDDELYPIGKMLLRNMDDAVSELRVYQRSAGEYYVHNTESGYYRIIMSPEFGGGYFSTDNINLKMIGKIKVHDDYSWEWIEQYDTVNESATFNQVKKIVDNIPKEEHHWFYHGKEFKDSPYVKYRDVMYLRNGRGKTIGGFIDVYAFDSDPDTGIVVIALEPGARGTGLATKLVQKALKKLPSLGIKKVIWRADVDNIASQKLAEKLGFTDISDLKANPDQYKYEYILNEMYLNSLSAAVEDTTELHEMSPKDKQAIANKYGLRTPGEYQQDGQDKTQERVNQRREKQLKDLKKARKIKKRKAFVRKVKSHLPDAQNESAMGILSMPKVVSSPPFDIDDKVDLYVGLANKKINEYEKAAKNIPVPKRKFKKNSNKNRSVPDYYLKLWFNPDRASNLLINDAAPNQHTIWLYPDEYCTLMFVCADGVCRVYMLDSYIAGDYYQFLGTFQVDMGIGARLKAALKEDSSGVDDSESDHYEADATDRDPLWGDRNHFFKHPNAAEEDYDKSIQENYKFELVDKNLRFVDRLDEATTKSQKLYPVYVVLVHSGTGVSKAIKAISHSEYSHASICFDSSLDKMYSFARKDPRNPFIGGFRYESIGKGFYDQKEIPYAVYVVPCTENQIKKMKKRLNYFIQNQEKFTFDFTGLVTNYLGIVNNPAHRWFCSRFVADVLNAGAPKNNPYVAEPSLQDPDDFKDTDWAIYVDSGENLMKYDRKKVDRKTNQILRKEMLRRMTVNESAIFDLDAFNPFIESTLNYQFAMMDEAVVDDFVRYLKSFKVKFDKEGNVIISRREVDQLDKHFRQSLRMIKAYENAGDLDSVKLELCKINYMIELINEYYLSPKAMKSTRVKADLRKEMLDLRSVMLNAFSQHLKYVKTMDPAFNFKSYYDTSIYGKNIEIPKPVLSAIGKAIVTRL